MAVYVKTNGDKERVADIKVCWSLCGSDIHERRIRLKRNV